MRTALHALRPENLTYRVVTKSRNGGVWGDGE